MTQPRRHLQKAVHCLVEAMAVMDRKEDPRCANDDIKEALQHIASVHPTIKSMAKGAERAMKGAFTEEKP
jgi:hypothetical protein